MGAPLRIFIIAVVSFLGAGCSAPLLPVDKITGSLSTPTLWNAQMALQDNSSEDAQSESWWNVFKDPALDVLINHALSQNIDFAILATRVRRARAELDQLGTITTPDVQLGFAGSISRRIDKSEPSARSYSSQLNIGYEVDFWGKYGVAIDSAAWALRATEFDRQAAVLMLIASVADSYWTLVLTQEELEVQKEDLESSERLLSLVSARAREGYAQAADVERAAQDLAMQRINFSDARLKLESARLTLANLLNERADWNYPNEPITFSNVVVPDLNVARPASVLARRPDVQAAEARLHQSYADVELVRLNFYPSLLLGASRAGGGRDFGEILTNPVGSIGATLALPFLQFRKMRFSVEAGHMKYIEAGQQFAKVVNNAILEVESALENVQAWANQEPLRMEIYRRAQAVESASELRYRMGQDSLKSWIDSRQSVRQAETALRQNRYRHLKAVMRVMQTMGGA